MKTVIDLTKKIQGFNRGGLSEHGNKSSLYLRDRFNNCLGTDTDTHPHSHTVTHAVTTENRLQG